MQESVNEAELQALMAVVKAKDAGVIKARNILKMDKKVNESLRQYLTSGLGMSY